MPAGKPWRVIWNRDFECEAAALFARYRAAPDAAAFARLVEQLSPRLVPLVRARLRKGRRHLDPREVIHDAFVQIFRARATFEDRGPGSFIRWFVAIADNLTRQDCRSDRRRVGREQCSAQPIADRSGDPYALLVAGEEERLAGLTWAAVRRLVLEGVQRLPPAQWEALVTLSREPMTYAALAQRLHAPRGAVIMRVQRARVAVLAHVRRRLADGSHGAAVAAAFSAFG
ncbi:MAG: sigma-70 family RNA polymerase sigma factor [Planctomycetes bacterium]|nr:sigma-70 family RNA polymerase sigma factor [Planctomycetota bacterium]